VTHEMAFAREADGAVVETGPPDEVLGAPKPQRTRQFLARVLPR
jgi:polar amino acid transport system ATP-binding protein